jgi:NTP pyrophosphatase (non-canonical NTP hydrolase)
MNKRTIDAYIEDAKRTESLPFIEGLTEKEIRLLHAQMGMQTESAEFTDALKKHIFYGKPLDKVNLKEELGDMLWYIAIALDCLDTDFETQMKINIDKLKARYPEKFTNQAADIRDLQKEREILEQS